MIHISQILPIELSASFETLAYEEAGWVSIENIQFLEKEVVLDFKLPVWVHEDGEGDLQHWQLQVLNFQDGHIDLHCVEKHFSFYSDHYLLWPFIDEQVELYARKKALHSEQVLANIYSLHKNVFNGDISVDRFIADDILTQTRLGHTLFAIGPRKILTYYFDYLSSAGQEPYFYSNVEYNAVRRKAEGQCLLVTLGKTYFVGSNFAFKRLDQAVSAAPAL